MMKTIDKNKIDRDAIIENLEYIFLYLGCANIDTSPMDGAVPMNCIAKAGGDKSDILFEHRGSPSASGLDKWNQKMVCFSNEKLRLYTAQDAHWTAPAFYYSGIRKDAAKMALPVGSIPTSVDFDSFCEMSFSRINKFGKFEKFKVHRHRFKDFSSKQYLWIKKIYNPFSIIGYREQIPHLIASQNEELFEEERLSDVHNMLLGIAASWRFLWIAKVWFSYINCSLNLITDPTGIKELWKLRDIPDGKKKRTALLHWVSEHWRANRNDPDIEHFVRKHMAGNESLKHGDFSVTIKASDADNRAEELFRQEREWMRHQNPRPDIRRRLKVCR